VKLVAGVGEACFAVVAEFYKIVITVSLKSPFLFVCVFFLMAVIYFIYMKFCQTMLIVPLFVHFQ